MRQIMFFLFKRLKIYTAILFCIAQFILSYALADVARISRIVGGEVAQPGKWPWMVALVEQDSSQLEGQFCGGTLIDPQWVLTAAHCVDDIIYSVDAIFGVTNLRIDTGVRIQVKEIILHPDYNRYTLSSDIALLKLDAPVSYPILNLDRAPELNSTEGVVIGWGNTSDIPVRPAYLDELRSVSLPIISFEQCNEIYHHTLTEKMFCAGYTEGGKDSCDGDSGGPFVILAEDDIWQQAGIISFGDGCAQPGVYGVYTHISQFTNFIFDTLCELRAPIMNLNLNQNHVSITWTSINNAAGYELHYAPFPVGSPKNSIDLKKQRSLSVELPRGSAFYIAIKAYSDICRSKYSNSDFFVIP